VRPPHDSQGDTSDLAVGAIKMEPRSGHTSRQATPAIRRGAFRRPWWAGLLISSAKIAVSGLKLRQVGRIKWGGLGIHALVPLVIFLTIGLAAPHVFDVVEAKDSGGVVAINNQNPIARRIVAEQRSIVLRHDIQL
jgi:hypothetical protein